jgi:hypothetical protein
MVVYKDQEVAGNYAVASIVHSSVAFDGVGSFERQGASTAVASAVMAEAGSEFYAPEVGVLVGRSFADVVAIETQIRCPGEKSCKLISKNQ